MKDLKDRAPVYDETELDVTPTFEQNLITYVEDSTRNTIPLKISFKINELLTELADWNEDESGEITEEYIKQYILPSWRDDR